MSSESHQTSDLPAQSGQTSVLHRQSWRKLALASLITLLAFTGAAYGLYLKGFADAGSLPLEEAKALSVTVVDRDDRLLRAFTTTEGKWRLPLDPKDFGCRAFGDCQ